MKSSTCKFSSLDRHMPKYVKSYSSQKVPKVDRVTSTTNVLKKCAGYRENEDLDWLEKLVHGFEWYKDKNNNLFSEKV